MSSLEFSKSEKKRFSLIARIKSANHAWRGVKIMFSAGHNVRLYMLFLIAVIYLGYALCISSLEWVALVIVIGLVFVTEAINTAIEIHMDLTSPEFHPHARDTKDVSAGASLLAVFTAVIVGLIIFLPKVIVLL
ncbi:MAG: diacylglycerol kinase family protein [Candidatus Pacebacteria bacterium]|nr:diacylglycerol kinase family protein [Candidatus Paceibacterota bacterium]MCF7862734.1 diacylglycerol kinase family protein [Candidatus Paceibacterota bacterium]